MELVDNEDVETMVALYCQNQSGHTELIQLFVKLADVEPAKDFTPLSEQHGVQDMCTELPKAPGPCLQIHLVMIEIDANSEDEYDNNGPSDCEVEDYSNSDLDEVSNDIDDECANDNENVTHL
ncbi:hypothetical protein GOBAR_AA30657 [Gossypium barbadense]|uniref:Uncharacterized protein n=1 Tax=Gossypium barbadense TaxID=3634 RepID=A0A2P5WG43_GOSBA|nr:hypothetical protein GOBAR_AA30657 [Gossypium barbadense]